MNRKDASGTADVCVEDFNQDNNPFNDLGNPTGSGSGNGGAYYASSYTTNTSSSSSYTSNGYYSSSVSYTLTTNGSTTSTSTSSTYTGSYGNGSYEGFYSYTMSLETTIGGRGMQNPAVRSAVLRGQAMHKQMDYGPGVEKEVQINSRCRVDGIDRDNHTIYELKPNNPRAIARGNIQLDRYVKAAINEFGGTWHGKLVLY